MTSKTFRLLMLAGFLAAFVGCNSEPVPTAHPTAPTAGGDAGKTPTKGMSKQAIAD